MVLLAIWQRAVVLNEMLEVWPPIPAAMGSDWNSKWTMLQCHRQWEMHEPAVQVVGVVTCSEVISE